MGEGILRQMITAGMAMDHTPVPEFEGLMGAIFETAGLPPMRRLWYEPIGHVMLHRGRLYVMRENEEYTAATREEVALWNEFTQHLHRL